MKIKRFFSHDMRTVIKLVREELGADAVILSNNRVNGGVEIIAAVDYDESLLASQADTADAEVSDDKSQGEVEFSTDDRQQAVAESAPHELTQDNQRGQRESILLQNPFESTKRRQKETASMLRYLEAIDKQAQRFKKNRTDTVKSSPAAPVLTSTPALTQAPARAAASAEKIPNEKKPALVRYTVLNESQDNDKPLTDILNPTTRINDTLYDLNKQKETARSEARNGGSKKILNSTVPEKKEKFSVWSQEPTLVDMRNEIKTLRGLLEQQLTGLAWGDMARKSPVKAKLIRELLELDLSPHLVKKLVETLSDDLDFASAWPNALALFANHVPIYDEDITAKGGIIALVGVTGVGKTTTLAKMAARYALRQGRQKVALITTDNYRIAAHEQLRTYGRILNIPVRVANNKLELSEVIKSFSDREFILIDTAGMGQRDHRLDEQFDTITNAAPGSKIFLTLSTTTHRTGLEEIAATFSHVKLNGCILTKLDETTSLGGALSVALMSRLPIAYVSDGQKVPEDFHLARAHSLVSRMLSIVEQRDEPMQPEAVELAFNGMMSNAGV